MIDGIMVQVGFIISFKFHKLGFFIFTIIMIFVGFSVQSKM